MPHLKLNLFGPLHVTLGDTPVTGFRSDKTRALLAYLAISSDRPHRRDALAGLLWPELTDEKAHDNLRLALHRLRAALGHADAGLAQAVLQVTPKTIQFTLHAEGQDAPLASVDTAIFTGLLAECRAHRHVRMVDCNACSKRLAQAVELYRGELLEGFFLDSQPFEEWLLVQREALRSQALETLYVLAEHAETSGDYAQAQRYARRQLQIDPWREEAHYQLMRTLALSGKRRAALAQYEACANLLAQELGAEPEDEMQALYEQLLTGEKLLPETTSAVGEASGFPSLSTPFIGRLEELAQVEAALEQTDCRLLTLVGPGGTGKSRLAIQAGRKQAGARLNGAHFISLSGIDTPDFLISAIANALGISLRGRGEFQAQFLNALHNKEMLLVLDNFEHHIQAAPVLGEILNHTSGIKLLVTSRQRLNLPGERVITLPGLNYPAGKGTQKSWSDLEEFSAIQLFDEVARRQGVEIKNRPKDWPAIVQVCQLVDGLPLGIELAASWLCLLSPHEIAQEIERDLKFLAASQPDLPERHRSLQAVCDASWKLLEDEERTVLASLSVFRGGFTLEAARQVAGATPHLLSVFADQSLLRCKAEGYFEIHELLRKYAEAKLFEQPGECEATRRRYSEFYKVFAAQRQGALQQALKTGERPTEILAEFDRESDNLQASWQWLLRQPGDIGEIDLYVEGLGLVYDFLGRPQQAAWLYELVLERHAIDDPKKGAGQTNQYDDSHVNWEYNLGKAYLSLGRVEKGKQQIQTALKHLGQRLPSTTGSLTLALFGQVGLQVLLRILPVAVKQRWASGSEQYRQLAERAFAQLVEVSYISNQRLPSLYYALRVLNLAEGGGASPEQARTQANFCLGAGMLGLHGLAGDYYRQARQTAQQVDDALTHAYVFQVTGIYDIGLGRWESARQALAHAAQIFERMGYLRQWGECVMPQAVIASAQGNFRRVTDLLEVLFAASRESGDLLQEGWVLGERGYLELLSGEIESALATLQKLLEINTRIEHLPGIITARGLLSVAHLRRKEYLPARQTADAAAALIERSSHTVFTNIEGYSAVVETYLGLVELDGSSTSAERKALLRQASQVLKAMRIQGRGIPAGLARYWMQLGLWRWLEGAHRQAFREWQRGLECARRLKILYDQGRICYEIGRHLPISDPQRRVYLQQACQVLALIGEKYYLSRVQAEMGLESGDYARIGEFQETLF
jgi:DNA-binding SARP family transcriptional activator/predicted ATPase